MLNILPNYKAFHGHSPKSATPALALEPDQCSIPSLDDTFTMEKTIHVLDWRPIGSAPANVDLELSIFDNREYHALVFPCRRDGLGWRDVAANRPMPLEPTHWRLWRRESPEKDPQPAMKPK